MTSPPPKHVSIAPLLKILSAPPPQDNSTKAEDIALAFSRTFENELNHTQLAALLTLLHSTGKDRHPDVIAKCAQAMRDAAVPVDKRKLREVVRKRRRVLGGYRGGLCDIVGTGGDSHSTFNISTTASIIASPILKMAKHGNRAQTSMSGSADVLNAISPKPPKIESLTADQLPEAYEHTNYTFLYAPNFHPGMKYAATVRRELGLRTIFNLMGPLANPVEAHIEARVVGVAYQELGPVFAQALQLSGASKAMVVCGQEDLDEISCAGKTNCWLLRESENPQYRDEGTEEEDEDTSDDEAVPRYVSTVETFALEPADFGLPSHPLSQVGGGGLPKQNAAVLMSILRNERPKDDPILHFVLMNVASLLVVSGACDAGDADTCESGEVIKERGPAGGRWKEGVKKARWCIESGRALQEFEKFIEFTNKQ